MKCSKCGETIKCVEAVLKNGTFSFVCPKCNAKNSFKAEVQKKENKL
jgi:formylmethanofuran dehydrogenase subunit E